MSRRSGIYSTGRRVLTSLVIASFDRFDVGGLGEQRIGRGLIELDSVVADAARLLAAAVVINDEGQGNAVDREKARITILFLHIRAFVVLACVEGLRGQ